MNLNPKGFNIIQSEKKTNEPISSGTSISVLKYNTD